VSSASNGVSVNSYFMQITSGGFSPGIGLFCAAQGIMTRSVFPLYRNGDGCCRHSKDELSGSALFVGAYAVLYVKFLSRNEAIVFISDAYCKVLG
jgi:hypothetical protein